MSSQLRRLEVCITQLRCRESACGQVLKKLSNEKKEFSEQLTASRRDFSGLCRRIRAGVNSGCRGVLRSQLELVGKEMQKAKRCECFATQRLSAISQAKVNAQRDMLNCEAQLKRLHELVQACRAVRKQWTASEEQELVVEAAVAARISNSFAKTADVMAREDPKGVAALIVRRIESLHSREVGLEQGLRLNYVSGINGSIGLTVSGSSAHGLVITLSPDTQETAQRLKNERNSIKRALTQAGLAVRELLVSDSFEEVAA